MELLRSTGSHPAAGWLYNKLLKEFPDLSMGTVYRNLNILIEQGLINKSISAALLTVSMRTSANIIT